VTVGAITLAGIGTINVIRQEKLEITQLQERRSGQILIVSHRVAEYLHEHDMDRPDVFCLGDPVYDTDRHMIGAKSLMTFMEDVAGVED